MRDKLENFMKIARYLSTKGWLKGKLISFWVSKELANKISESRKVSDLRQNVEVELRLLNRTSIMVSFFCLYKYLPFF